MPLKGGVAAADNDMNLDRIRELQPMFHGDYTVILRDGTKLALSRNYRERLAHLLGR